AKQFAFMKKLNAKWQFVAEVNPQAPCQALIDALKVLRDHLGHLKALIQISETCGNRKCCFGVFPKLITGTATNTVVIVYSASFVAAHSQVIAPEPALTQKPV